MATCSIPAKEQEFERTMEPNWLELPVDITSNILQRLGTIEIVTCACHVCPQWWNICKDPLMWRTIHITRPRNVPIFHDDLEKICRFAVKRSCGHLEEINIEYFATDDLLECIADNDNIRCLRLSNCRNISNKGCSEAVRKLSILEELDISYSDLSNDSVQAIGRSCPLLKSFSFATIFMYMSSCDEFAFIIAEKMQGLRRLNIERNRLTKAGLLAILDACPLLEYINLQQCEYLDFTGSLRQRCNKQITYV